MTWIDFAIIGIFLFYCVEGVRRGFIEQVFELVGFLLSIFIAFWIYKPFAPSIASRLEVNERLAEPIAFLVVWLIIQTCYSLIMHFAYPLVPEKLRAALPNRLAGLVPASLRALILIAVILVLLIDMPVSARLKSDINDSVFGSRIVARSGVIEQSLSRVVGRDIKETLTFLTVPPSSESIVEPNERVDLKFTTTEVRVDRQSEQKMLELLNQERVKVGLPPLKWNEKVAETARKHSTDMFARGYFSHQNLDGESPFDRMQRDGITFKAAGENIAYAANVDLAHSGLMRSPGHRANILEKDFGSVGIGVIDGGIHGKMFTQNFTD